MRTFSEFDSKRLPNGKIRLGNKHENLICPRHRWWFYACKNWIDNGGITPRPEDVFDAKDYKLAMASVHLDLAALIRDNIKGKEYTSRIASLADQNNISLLLLEDLTREFSGKPLRIFERKINLQALFVQSYGKGVSGFLEMDLVADGQGHIYPAPSMAFIERLTSFSHSEKQALSVLNFPSDKDIRWRLVLPDEVPFPAKLEGGSLGAAFGLGVWLLINEQESNYPNWMGVAATAQLCAGGQMEPVDHVFTKLVEAGRHHSLPAIHTVLTATKQDLSKIIPVVPNTPDGSILEHRDVHGLFHLIQAGELLRAAHVIRTHLGNRWALNNEFEFIFDQNRNIIGRAWVRAQVHDFVLNSDKRFLVLTAGPGYGKTGIVTDLIVKDHKQRLEESYNQVFGVYHFIKRQAGALNDPVSILKSLIIQIRRLFALEELSSEQIEKDVIPIEPFRNVLNRASERLGKNHHLVIYLDGLDEAFGPLSKGHVSLDKVIPLNIPKGVKFVMTSRPAGFLDCLNDPRVTQRASLDDYKDDQIQDIEEYLALRIRRLNEEGVEVGIKLVQDLLRAAQGNFMVAVQYLANRPGLERDLKIWINDPHLIPVGLKEWLTSQWSHLEKAAKTDGVSESTFRRALGLIAYAEQPLSFSQWEQIIKEIPTDWNVSGETFEKTLKVAQEYFVPLEYERQKYLFIHSCISEFIREKQLGDDAAKINSAFAKVCMKSWDQNGHSMQDYAQDHLPIHLSHASDWETLLDSLVAPLKNKTSSRRSNLVVKSFILLGQNEAQRSKVHAHCEQMFKLVFQWFRPDKAQKSYLANILLQTARELKETSWIARLGCHRRSDIRTLAISHTYFLWKQDKDLCIDMLKNMATQSFYLSSIPKLRKLEFLFGTSVIILTGHPDDQKTLQALLGSGHIIIKRMRWIWPATYAFLPFVSELIRQIPDDYNPINPVEYRFAKDEIQSDPSFQKRAAQLNQLLLDPRVDTQQYRKLIEELIEHHPGNIIIISIFCLLQFKVALNDFDEAIEIGIMTAEHACDKSVTVFQSAVYQLFFLCIGKRRPSMEQYSKIKELWSRYYDQELFDFGFKPKWTRWRRFRSRFGYQAKEPYLNIWISGFGLLIAKMENFVRLEDASKLRELFDRYDDLAKRKGDGGKFDTAVRAFLRGLDIVGAEIGSMDVDGLRVSQATLIYILNHRIPPSDPEFEIIAKTLVRLESLRPEESATLLKQIESEQIKSKLLQFKNKCKYRENMGGLIGTRIAEFYRHAFEFEHWNREFFKMYQAFIEKPFFFQSLLQMVRMVLGGLRDYKPQDKQEPSDKV